MPVPVAEPDALPVRDALCVCDLLRVAEGVPLWLDVIVEDFVPVPVGVLAGVPDEDMLGELVLLNV